MLFILLRDYKILFGVPKIFLLHKVVRDAKKVEKHCSRAPIPKLVESR